MVDAAVLREILSLESAAWAAVAMLFLLVVRMWNGAPAIMETWILYKQSREAAKAGDWHRLREEIRRLSESEERCRRDYQQLHRQHMEVIERLSALEGYMAGQGKASQEAAGIVALERLKDKKDKP